MILKFIEGRINFILFDQSYGSVRLDNDHKTIGGNHKLQCYWILGKKNSMV